MKNILAVLIFIGLLLLSGRSFSEIIEIENRQFRVDDWGATDKFLADTVFIKDPLDRDYDVYIETAIDYSNGKDARLYFVISYKKPEVLGNICDINSAMPDEIWQFNDQAVAMLLYCRKFSDSARLYVSATPETEEGLNYIVGTLKRAESYVDIQALGIIFPVSAKNFTASWNSRRKGVL